MVRLLPTLFVLFAGVSSVTASWCQCLKPDGSHCCVIPNEVNDCRRMCNRASPDPESASECRAGGKWSKVSTWNAKFRAQCSPPFLY